MRARTFLFPVLFLFALPQDAAACSCANFGPVAELIKAAHCSATAVFVGVVTEVFDSARGRSLTDSDLRVRFTVEEAWRGINSPEAEMWTGNSSSTCGYKFVPGERYLVYGYGDPAKGKLLASTCSRTRPIVQATDDLAYIRSFPRTGPAARIYGGVYHAYGENVPPVPHPGVRVAAERSDGFVAEALTDARGHFDISGLAPGTYSVDVIRPPAEKAQKQTVTLHDPFHCAQLSFDY